MWTLELGAVVLGRSSMYKTFMRGNKLMYSENTNKVPYVTPDEV